MKILLRNLLIITFYLSCSSAWTQLDQNYFNKLKNEKVSSDQKLEWIQLGPGMSGYCEFFWPHPTDPKAYYMAPDMFNGYTSLDGAKSWKSFKDYDGEGADMGRTYDIEFSRQNANLGFAIDELGGLFKTTNKGRSWEKTTFNLEGAHNEIAVDPYDDNIWYIGAGTFWDVKRFHRTATDNTGGEFRPKAVLGHIYKSTNKGLNWRKIKNGLPNTLAVGKIIVDPRNTNRIIMVANTGLYISTDRGENWVKSENNGLPNNLPRDLTSHFNTTTKKLTLYLVDQTSFHAANNSYTTQGGIYKSIDGGRTWTTITGDLGLNLDKITSNNSKYYFKRSVAKWFDKDINSISNIIPTNKVLQNYNRIVVNPKNPDEIYVSHNVKHDFSFGPGDIWKTENSGKNWFPCGRTGKYWINKADQSYWNNRAVSVTGMNTSFAHLQHEMEIREEIWGARFLSISPEGDLFTSLDQQIVRSKDGGKSWQQIDDDETSSGSNAWISKGDSNLPGRYIYLETGVPDRKFFLSGEHGLWKSAPLGDFTGTARVATTQIEGQVNPGGAHSTATLAVHPTNPDKIYTLQFRQNHRNYFRGSNDGGKTWKNIGKPFEYQETNTSSEHIYSSSLMIEPENPNTIYFTAMRYSPSEINEGAGHAFDKFGVYKSSDGGKNWSIKNNGFPDKASIRRIAMHPNRSNELYAASNFYKNVNGGLYKTTDRANSWTKMTIPNAITSVNNVHINKTTGAIYISCGTRSGSDTSGGVWKSSNNGNTWTKIFDLNYVWQAETSPINPDLIIVAVPRSSKHINPGAYISKNGGNTWTKVNKNLAHPHSITDIKPDHKDETIFWSAGWGSGWYKGIIQGDDSNNSETKTPFNGTAQSIPGKIQAEDFDKGGLNLSYNDTDITNKGNSYRVTEGVDIQPTTDLGGGYNIGWTKAGEWLEYTVDFTKTQPYDFFPRIASINNNGQLNIKIDGKSISNPINIPDTGGYQTYENLYLSNIPVEKGIHIVRIEIIKGGFNINSWAAWPTPISTNLIMNYDTETNQIEVYPNPIGNESLKIKLNQTYEGLITYAVTDVNGKKVVFGESNEKEIISIPTTAISSKGIYILTLVINSEKHTYKIIK
ncbi:carbohydrate-binding protein [Cellulophaga sp. HaHa_2_95]|uniref:VPS10 domain-containing protein n=1 Tax=Cellulophaga sp. HaHa_2_95 TaxID=2745558 RepID=UPI001C4EDB23|nr:carbohydrate-binding protein [Cellulophaga sp. HaHa_2_95]QXP56124.1 carbohydrate-binding protein [Cellulophaga sp. HaHa_2_95]